MKRILCAALALLSLVACRQKDLREMTVDLPGLAPIAGNAAELAKAEAQIKRAFATYEKHSDPSSGRIVQENPLAGVDLGSFSLTTRKDGNGRDAVALSLRFDSLLVAEMNVIALLDGLVVSNVTTATGALPRHLRTEVRFPELKKDVPAGYINARKPEVRD